MKINTTRQVALRAKARSWLGARCGRQRRGQGSSGAGQDNGNAHGNTLSGRIRQSDIFAYRSYVARAWSSRGTGLGSAHTARSWARPGTVPYTVSLPSFSQVGDSPLEHVMIAPNTRRAVVRWPVECVVRPSKGEG